MKRNREDDSPDMHPSKRATCKPKIEKEEEKYKDKLRSNKKQLEEWSNNEGGDSDWETEEEIEITFHPFDREAMELDDPELKAEYDHIQEYLNRTRREITLKDILKAEHLSTEEKAETIELYKLLCSVETDDEDKLDRMKKLVRSTVLEGAENDLKKLTEDETKQLKETQERLKTLQAPHLRQTLSLKTQILLSGHADEYKKLLLERLERTDDMIPEDPDYTREMDIIKLALSLPIGVKKNIATDPEEIPTVLRRIRKNLDHDIGGMTRVKEQILEVVASRFANPHRKRDITTLVSDAGMGKTKLILSLAKALGIPVEIISLGGAKDKAVLTGFASTYVGAQAGRIIQAIKKMGCVNGIILFDEIDKVSDQTEEIHYALVNIMDPTQNHRFQDEYLQGIEIDISNVWFWASANTTEPINRILRNRMNFIYIPTPNRDEKINTFNKYIFPETLINVGLTAEEIILHEETATTLINKAEQLFHNEETKGYRKVIELLEMVLKKINLIKLYKAESGIDDNFTSSYPTLSFPVELNPELLEKLIREEDFTNLQHTLSKEIEFKLYS